jgi:hypothetical protein
MHLRSAFLLTVAWGLLTDTSVAFTSVTTVSLVTKQSSLNIGGQGWDNENFLQSLGNGDDAIKKANDEYNRFSRYQPNPEDDVPSARVGDALPDGSIKGAALTPEMVEEIKRQNALDQGEGGQRFKQLMERAQAGPSRVPPPPPAPPIAGMPAGYENLTVEQQAEMFRQMMAQQSSYQPPLPYVPPPVAPIRQPLGPPVARDGRRIGRNRDADAVQNTADVYFAQLKRDSTSRNIARYNGDEEFANQIFADPSIQDIKASVNPYLQESRKKEKEMYETSEDEMIFPEMFLPPKRNTDTTFAGPSYKEKLKKLKATKGTAPVQETTTAAPPQLKSPPQLTPPMPRAAAPQPSTPAAVPQATAPQPFTPVTTSSTSSSTETETISRNDIRTLMGLLLKHRGGPMMGSGRLQGADIERFASLSDTVMAALRNEGIATESSSAQHNSLSPVTTGPQQQTDPVDNKNDAKVDSMIACIDGAINMYKNCPEELKSSVLMTLRAALESAVKSVNQVLGPNNMPSVTGGSQSVDQAIAVIAGAVQMYKNSPVELHQPVLVTLRAALLSGIITMNSAAEVRNEQTSLPLTTATAPWVEGSVTPTQSYSGDDENTPFFEGVYTKLKSAAGDGKMGVRSDLSSEDATDLANDIAELRIKLVDELTSGIPSSSSVSSYQTMLAKTRAEKNAKKALGEA